MKTIDIIIPAFNEEDTLKETLVRLKNLKTKFKPVLDTNLIFINDGSQDKTLDILKKFSLSNKYIKIFLCEPKHHCTKPKLNIVICLR